MFEAFSKVTKVRGLGPTCPARTNLVTGEIQLNMDVWPSLSAAQKRDVVWHEEGHLVQGTLSEEAADRYSLEKQFRAGYSLKSAVNAMADILSPDSPDHVNRAWKRLQYAKQLDARRQNNSTMCANANGKKCVGCSGCSQAQTFANYGVLGVCFSKKCRQQKAAAKEAKMASKNEARVLLAAQGVKTGIGGLFQDIGAGIGGLVSTAKDLAPAVAAIAGAPDAYQGASNNTASQSLAVSAAVNPVTAQLQNQTTPPVLTQLTSGQPQTMTLEEMIGLKSSEITAPKNNTLLIVAAVVVVLIVLALLLTRKN